MNRLAAGLDRALDVAVIPSFTKLGVGVRRRAFGWTALDAYDLSGRTVVITGATSGLGAAAAAAYASIGARVITVNRDAEKGRAVVERLRSESGNDDIHFAVADLGDDQQVRRAAQTLLEYGPLDVLIHNAGALFGDRRTAPDGTELTTKVHVVSPFLLTGLLLPRLLESTDARVITVSSGGMYTAGLTIEGLEMDGSRYRGTEQYARAKRAQVTLNEMWAERLSGTSVRFHAMHPGWADTPGVESALPGFRRVVGPLLRDPEDGADTMVWLGADGGDPAATSGVFWLDRRPRPIHRLAATRRSDTPERRARLWRYLVDKTGLDRLPEASASS